MYVWKRFLESQKNKVFFKLAYSFETVESTQKLIDPALKPSDFSAVMCESVLCKVTTAAEV